MSIKGLMGATLADFWSWAYSDVLSNVNRSILAEFLVARALGLDGRARCEWDPYDLTYGDLHIEVKAAGRLQNWKQEKLSPVIFDIAEKRFWHTDTGKFSKNPERPAHIYVFCVHFEEEVDQCDPLDSGQWEFYVVPTSRICEKLGNQKSVKLGVLKKRVECIPVQLSGLKAEIDAAIPGVIKSPDR